MGRILERKAGSKNKSKDCGLQKPNGIFKFFFGINLSYKLYAMTDNLSKLLHSTKMPAIKGKKCADLVIYTLKSMKNDEDFDAFFEVVKKPAHPTKPAGKATLTRKQKSKIILSCHTYEGYEGYEGPESNAYHPETAHDYFTPVYFQALDAIISVINDRFEKKACIREIHER